MNHFASRGERFSAAGVRSIVVRDLALRLLRRRVVTIIAFLRVERTPNGESVVVMDDAKEGDDGDDTAAKKT